ncbi:hypothetical protein [Bartonella massiliensis]|nr:hypothetical protein [Bartonella massiliensis]
MCVVYGVHDTEGLRHAAHMKNQIRVFNNNTFLLYSSFKNFSDVKIGVGV